MAAISEDVILLDDTLTETFLTDLQSRGRTEETLKCYRNSLGKLCGFLPGRRLSHEAMRRWPEALREQGYCPSTINSAVSAANSLLAFCGRRGWQVMPSPLPETEQPELTREEYLRLLQTARILEKERPYLLVKLLGTTGLPVHLLDEVTVSAVQAGGLPEYDMLLYGSLRRELLDFAGREGILSGPIFVTRRSAARPSPPSSSRSRTTRRSMPENARRAACASCICRRRSASCTISPPSRARNTKSSCSRSRRRPGGTHNGCRKTAFFRQS